MAREKRRLDGRYGARINFDYVDYKGSLSDFLNSRDS